MWYINIYQQTFIHVTGAMVGRVLFGVRGGSVCNGLLSTASRWMWGNGRGLPRGTPTSEDTLVPHSTSIY